MKVNFTNGMGMCLCRECQDACPQNPKAWDIVKKVRGLK